MTARKYVIFLSILALFSAAAYFYWVARFVTYPYELDYGEGIVLWQAAHVTHLATAYAPITQYPYVVFHYPPLYHAVSFVMSKATGDLLIAGRLVSLLSTLGLCLTLAWIVYRSAPVRAPRYAAIAGAIVAGAFPCGLQAMDWALLMRVDMLGLWLTFAGLGLFILGKTAVPRYAAFVLFVAAMYTRQTLVAGAVTCLCVAAILNMRQAIKLLLFTATLGASVLTLLALATHGQVIRHLFLYNQNRFSIRQAISFLNENVQLTLPLLALAVAAASIPIRDLARAVSQGSLLPLRARLCTSTYRRALFVCTLHFILSGLVSLTAGKEGSNINYFLEWNLSACMLAGLLVARLAWGWRTTRSVSPAVAVAYLLPLLIVAQQAEAALRYVVPSAAARQETAEQARNTEALLRILRSSPEPVMSENMTLLYRSGQQVPFEPAIVAVLTASGAWDETPLIELIRKRSFSVMIIRDLENSTRYSAGVKRAIEESYRPSEKFGRFTVYRPLGDAGHDAPRVQGD